MWKSVSSVSEYFGEMWNRICFTIFFFFFVFFVYFSFPLFLYLSVTLFFKVNSFLTFWCWLLLLFMLISICDITCCYCCCYCIFLLGWTSEYLIKLNKEKIVKSKTSFWLLLNVSFTMNFGGLINRLEFLSFYLLYFYVFFFSVVFFYLSF